MCQVNKFFFTSLSNLDANCICYSGAVDTERCSYLITWQRGRTNASVTFTDGKCLDSEHKTTGSCHGLATLHGRESRHFSSWEEKGGKNANHSYTQKCGFPPPSFIHNLWVSYDASLCWGSKSHCYCVNCWTWEKFGLRTEVQNGPWMFGRHCVEVLKGAKVSAPWEALIGILCLEEMECVAVQPVPHWCCPLLGREVWCWFKQKTFAKFAVPTLTKTGGHPYAVTFIYWCSKVARRPSFWGLVLRLGYGCFAGG